VVYNNTGGDIVITLGPRKYRIEPGDFDRVRHPWLHDTFSVKTESEQWDYRARLPRYEELRMKGVHDARADAYVRAGFPARHVTLQINRDGKIFVLRSDVAPPQREAGEQPDGFPLVPLSGERAFLGGYISASTSTTTSTTVRIPLG